MAKCRVSRRGKFAVFHVSQGPELDRPGAGPGGWCNPKEIQSHARQSWARIRVSGSVHVAGEMQSQAVTARNVGDT